MFDDIPSMTFFFLTAKPNCNMLVKSRKILGAQPQNQPQSLLDTAHLDLSSWHHIATKSSTNTRTNLLTKDDTTSAANKVSKITPLRSIP